MFRSLLAPSVGAPPRWLFAVRRSRCGTTLTDRRPRSASKTCFGAGLLQERASREQQVLAEQLQSALSSRVLIEQVKGMFAERNDVKIVEAFTTKRGHARRTGQPLLSVATQVIEEPWIARR